MKHVLLPMVAAAFLATLQPAYSDEILLPDMGVTGSTRFTPQEERRLGEAFMRQVRQSLKLTEDPEVEEYIWNLGYRLVSNSDYRARPFYFFVVEDPTINAFAGPAGYIGIHTGLILSTDTESELAAVVAHEIAHVAQRHLDRAMDAADKLSLPTAGALIAAIILGGQNPNLAEAAIAATLAANAQTQINFTRGHETEADHIGMQVLARAGFDPRAMPAFFERLQQTDRLYDNQVPEFLRTHPVTINRIAEARNRVGNYEVRRQEEATLYHLMQAKLRVLTAEDPASLARDYALQLKEGRYHNEQAVRYGYGMALAESGNYAEARKQIRKLISEDRERITYLIALARIDMASGELEAGLDILHDALALSPRNTPLTRHYARALLQAGKAEKASTVLQEYISNSPETPDAYQLLAKAEGDAGRPGGAHRALAEYHFLYGETPTAVHHLQLALTQKDIDEREAKLIQARLEEIKQIAQEEARVFGGGFRAKTEKPGE